MTGRKRSVQLVAKRTRTQNTFLNTAAGMAAYAFNILTGFIMRSIFLATLGIEYTGISSLFTDLLTLLSFAELGIGSAIAFSLYKPIAQGDYKKVSVLMQFFKRAYQVVAGAVLGLGLLLIPFLKYLVPPEKINESIRGEVSKYIILIFVLYVINSAVSYLQVYKSTLLTAHQQQRKISSIQMIMSVVRVVVEASILLILNIFIKENRAWIFIVYLIAGIIITRTTNVIISVYADKRYPQVDYKIKEKLPKEEKKKLYKDVSALMIYKVCQEVNTSLDSIVMSAFYGPLWVGLISNYRLVTGKIRLVILQFFNAVTPSMGNLAAEKDAEYQYKTFRALQFMSFWICCFCGVSFLVLLNPFIEIWLGRDEMVMNVWIPITLSAIFCSHTILAPVSAIRNANGLFVQGKYRPIFLCVINVILSIVFAAWLGEGGKNPIAGVIGIKIATIISHLSTTHWYDPMIIYKHVFKRPLISYFKNFAIYVGVTAAAGIMTYGTGWLLFGSSTDGEFKGVLPGTPLAVSFIVKCIFCVVIPNLMVWLLFRKTEEYSRVVDTFKAYAGKLKNKFIKKPALKAEQ